MASVAAGSDLLALGRNAIILERMTQLQGQKGSIALSIEPAIAGSIEKVLLQEVLPLGHDDYFFFNAQIQIQNYSIDFVRTWY